MKKLYILFLLSSFIGFSQNPGDLVITEIMNNPAAVSDTVGEWFEIFNNTGSQIDIDGWVIRDDGSNTHTIDGMTGGVTVVPAGGYLVLGRSADQGVNGGAPVDYAYGETGFTLGNGADEVVLVAPGDIEIARVNYDGGPNFPDLTGESMQLDSSSLNETDNDNGANWCASTSAYGDGDLGTPGTANEACAPTCTTSLGASDTVCDAITTGVDTYTATLDFTGGDVGTTFTVTSDFGTVGGDNPSMMATGTIIVTGVPEGTDVTITVDDQTSGGGLCVLTRTVTSPICEPTGSIDLELQGIIDFTVPSGGSDGKAIHLVATADIADLSEYGLGSANNGGGTDGQEYTFPVQSVSNGDHILLVRSTTAMEAYFTTAGYNLFDVILEDTGGNAADGNGNDAVELFKNGVVVETFGDINDGTAASWNYQDSWAYKDTPGAVWPTGWIYGGVDCTDGSTTTFDSTCVYPFVQALSNPDFNATELSVYPNPVNSGMVTITSQLEGSKTIEMYDVMGRNVLSTVTNSSTLDISNLKSGMYLMKITIADRSTTKRLIVE